MTDRELMQRALEALEEGYQTHTAEFKNAITALRERLAQPKQSYPDNFIHALMYDVAKRDSEAQQAYEDAFVNGTGVLLGGKRIDPASIYKEPEQEPVAWLIWLHGPAGHFDHKQFAEMEFERRNKEYPDPDRKLLPLYTAPPQPEPVIDKSAAIRIATALGWEPKRTWQGLTDEEIAEMHNEIKVRLMGTYRTEDIYRAIEAKLKEKNT